MPKNLSVRRLILIPMGLCAVGHAYLMSQWMARWGFWGSLFHWLQTFTEDPISAAAGLDLIALYLIIAAWMLYREGRWTKLHTIILIPYFLFPSVGLMLYLVLSKKYLPGDHDRTP